MASALPKIDYSRFSKNGETFLAVGVVTILFVMLVPLPTFFMDIMLCVSISLAMLVLITTMFMKSPLKKIFRPVNHKTQSKILQVPFKKFFYK